MKNFKERVLSEVKDYKDFQKEGVLKCYIEENNYRHHIDISHIKKDIFDVNITALPLDMMKEIYSSFSMDLNVIKTVVDLHMSHMQNTQLTTFVPNVPTFNIDNFYEDRFGYEMVIPLKDRNVIANKDNLYTERKGFNVYPSVQVLMKFIVKGTEFEPCIDIYLPLARKERFLVQIKPNYKIEEIDNIIKNAIRQRVLCLLTTKRIKMFSRQDIREAEFDDIGRYMTLIAMDSI